MPAYNKTTRSTCTKHCVKIACTLKTWPHEDCFQIIYSQTKPLPVTTELCFVIFAILAQWNLTLCDRAEDIGKICVILTPRRTQPSSGELFFHGLLSTSAVGCLEGGRLCILFVVGYLQYWKLTRLSVNQISSNFKDKVVSGWLWIGRTIWKVKSTIFCAEQAIFPFDEGGLHFRMHCTAMNFIWLFQLHWPNWLCFQHLILSTGMLIMVMIFKADDRRKLYVKCWFTYNFWWSLRWSLWQSPPFWLPAGVCSTCCRVGCRASACRLSRWRRPRLRWTKNPRFCSSLVPSSLLLPDWILPG